MSIQVITKKDGTTVYRKQIFLGIDSQTGKKVKASVTAKTKKELGQLEAKKRLAFEQNGNTVKAKPTVTYYHQLVDLWCDTHFPGFKYHTQRSIGIQFQKHLLPTFGKLRLDKITRPLVQSVLNDWAKAYNQGLPTAYKSYSSLLALHKRVLSYAVALDLITHNPCSNLIFPKRKTEKKATKHFEPHELKSFLDYLDCLDQSDYRNLYDTTLYRFLLATGCRIGEALALEWSDIDLETGKVTLCKNLQANGQISTPKTQSSHRTISIDRKTVLALRLYQARQNQQCREIDSPYGHIVFSGIIRPYQMANNIRYRLRYHLEQAGLAQLSFHAFRHTHASLMINNGMGPKELQYRLGHSNISTTLDIYTHLSKDKEKEAVNVFEKAIDSL